KQGFENVVLLNGGLMTWENEGLAIIPGIMTKVVAEYTLDQYHEEIAAYPLVMVDFFAEWCGPCKMMEPTMKKLKESYSEEQLKIIKVDVDHNPDIAAYFKVNSIPVLKVYHNGELKH